MVDCLSQLVKQAKTDGSEEQLVKGLAILQKLLSNIKEKPTDQRFKILNKANKAIQAKLLSLEPRDQLMKLIEELGFAEDPDDAEKMIFQDYYLVFLGRGLQQINQTATQLKNSFPVTAEDQERLERNKKERMAFLQEQKAEAERKKAALEGAKREREEEKARRDQLKMNQMRDQQLLEEAEALKRAVDEEELQQRLLNISKSKEIVHQQTVQAMTATKEQLGKQEVDMEPTAPPQHP